MENRNTSTHNQSLNAQSTPPPPGAQSEAPTRAIIGIVIGIIFLLAVLGLGIYLLQLPTTDTAKIRDIFIIIMALQSLVIGLTLVILIVQIARLINLLQNEIKPILDSTNETVSNLRGTSAFISENLTEPVIKLNTYLAGLTRMVKLIGITRKKPKE